jgi:hypothetical protein
LGIFRFLFILFAGMLLLRLVNTLKLFFKQGYQRKDHQQQTRHSRGPQPKGSVTIDVDPRQGKSRRPKVGEYVDFEEIKD